MRCARRTVYDNLKKAILFILPTNVGEAAIIIAAITAGVPLPIAGTDPVDQHGHRRHAGADAGRAARGRRDAAAAAGAGTGLIDAVFVRRLLLVGLLMLVFPFLLYLWAFVADLPVAHASALAVNCMVAVEIAYLFNTRTGIRSALGLTALRAPGQPGWQSAYCCCCSWPLPTGSPCNGCSPRRRWMVATG